MKIAIDGRGAILYRGTGIGTYTWQLLRTMAKEDIRIFLPGEELKGLSFNSQTLELDTKVNWEDDFLPKAITREGIDLYHVPQNGLGLPGEKRCWETVTIHDMIPYMFPETVGRGYLRDFLGKMPGIMEAADGIITVSQASKEDIMALFGYPEDKIAVIYEAAEPIYKPMPKEEARSFLQEKYGINGEYFLYVGGYGIRKNVKALILAYHLLCREHGIGWRLLLPGRRSGEFERLTTLVDALGLEEKVIFPGYVPVGDMPYFYGGAKVMVYPSIYEGFGLPPLEAMSMGTPVIASNRSSLPEILGNAPLYFDPFNTVELAEKMYILYDNEAKAIELSRRSLNHAGKFSWEHTAAETLTFWRGIAKG
ncbi:MAG: glycosyltransferase family 1 protein [Bacillota bacterium]|nr:glycosyltransferase family 1 protein [Bacillota bacterium]